MGWKFVGLLGVVLMVPMPAPAQSLSVRTYNNSGVPAEDLLTARTRVDAIFSAAGVNLSWLDCWYRDSEAANAPAQCRQPLGVHEVTLRLQAPNTPQTNRYVSMGFSLVNLEAGAPFLATVFPDLVASISRSAGIDFRLLLGRAVAHELGHLLLNTSRHADRGLMRAGWSRAELRKNDEGDWEFLEEEIAAIRRGAMARTIRLSTHALP